MVRTIRSGFLSSLLIGLMLVSASAVQAQTLKNPPGSFADLVENLIPSVVNISSTHKITDDEPFPDMPQFPPGSPFEEFFEQFMDRHGNMGPSMPATSLGSGFIIDAEKGYVVTNAHVIQDADEVRVTLHDDTTITAEVIGSDEKTDLAVLKIDPKEHALIAVEFGESKPLRVGDWVLAIGNPFGLGGTVTAGIISARQRDINAGPYDDFLQTDASINRGNSGGPMFDINGKVIGINTAIFSPSGGSVGIGFAIPSDLARPVIDQLIEYGRTRRGWLGVRIQSVTDEIAESLGLDQTQGALVAAVTPDGPAEKAGLESGDIILEFDGKKVDQMRDLPRIVAETRIDKDVKVRVWRDEKSKTFSVKVGELEKAEDDGLLSSGYDGTSTPGVSLDSVGLRVSAITDTLRRQYNIAKKTVGVVITKIEDDSEAVEKGVVEGDVILEINQKKVDTPDEVKDILEKAGKAGRKSVLLLIDREGDTRFVALKI